MNLQCVQNGLHQFEQTPQNIVLLCFLNHRNYTEAFDCYTNCSIDGIYENLVTKVTFNNKTAGHEILGQQRYEMMSLLRTQLIISCNPSELSHTNLANVLALIYSLTHWLTKTSRFYIGCYNQSTPYTPPRISVLFE